MSHFTILVKVPQKTLARHDDNIEAAVAEMLEPYDENIEKAPYRVALTPDNITSMADFYQRRAEEQAEQTGKEKPDTFAFSSGTWTAREVGTFVAVMKPGDCYIIDQKTGIMRKKLEKLFTDHMDEWDGRSGGIDDEGPFKMSTYNPESKWDWWVTGGRWRGGLRMKEGVAQVLGDPGTFESLAIDDGKSDGKRDPCLTDVCKAKDLDIEGMELSAAEELKELFESYQLAKIAANKSREEQSPEERAIMEPLGLVSSMFDMGIVTREQLGESEGSRPEFGPCIFKEIPDLPTFQKKYHGWAGFSTWGVLDSDGWHDKGNMGWFGCHSGTTDQFNQFQNSYMDTFIKGEDPETTLVLVDCHI